MRVLVECYHDVALVRSLGVPIRRVGHELSKGNVLRTLARSSGRAIGIVDADPGKPHSNPSEMAKYQEDVDERGLRLMKHRDDPHKSLVIIHPRLEEWLLARAEACGIQPAEYGLPPTARDMHRSARCDRKPGFGRFLADLAASDDGLRTLSAWLGV